MWQLLLQLVPADGAGGESVYAERVTAALRTVGLQPSEVERIGQAFTEMLRQAPQREDGDRFLLSVRIWIMGLPAAVDPTESGPEDQDVRRRNRGGWGFFLLERKEDEPGTTEGKTHRIIELYLYRESSLARKTRSKKKPKNGKARKMGISSKSGISAILFLALTLLPMSATAQNSMVAMVIPYSNSSTAYAINELDQVAGTGIQSLYFGFRWDNGNVNRIYGFSGWYTEAYDINDWNQVVGESYWWSSTTQVGAYRAILWENGVVSDLGTLGGVASVARAINNLGQVVGSAQIASDGPYGGPSHAFLWQDGSMGDLGTLGGDHSAANDINDLSQVVGYSQTAAGETHAFLWENGAMTDLGTLGGAQSFAHGINDLGQVVGESTTASGETHAFLWENGMMTDLGTLDRLNSTATSINNLGQVVGHSYTDFWSDSRAFLWESGVMTDLGTLGGAASQAEDINDLGHIVGRSQTTEGVPIAFLWTYVLPPPTPEERIAAIIEQVDALVAGGWLNEGQGNALRSKLDSVLRQLDMENGGAACSLLQAFSNQVDSLVLGGILTVEQGQPLIDSAGAVSSELCP